MMNNSKNSILLVDPEFDPQTASSCALLIKITGDSFSYAIIDTQNKQLKAVFDMQECDPASNTLQQILKNDSYLQIAFQKVKAAMHTPFHLNVPNEVFVSGEAQAYANFFPAGLSGNLYTRPCEAFDFTAVFHVEQATTKLLEEHFPGLELFDQHAPLLSLAAKAATEKQLLLDFTANSFQAVLLSDHKLIYLNTFEFDNSEEFNYYILLLIKQLNLKGQDLSLQLSGIIHENDSQYHCLLKYFNQINFTTPPAGDMDQTILDDMPGHYYSSLIALDSCV